MRKAFIYFKNTDLICFFGELRQHRFMLCSLVFCGICGIGMGCISSSEALTFTYYAGDIKIFGVIFQNEPILTIFWSRVSLIFASCAIIHICSLSKMCLPLSFLFITFRGFMLGSNLLCATSLYGLNGIIIVIFLSLPINIALIVTHICMCTYGYHYASCDGRRWKVLCESTCMSFCGQLCLCGIEVAIIQFLVLPLIFIL
ncbi:MAG: hypothetical protein R3Y65_02375 [Bacillota bacterium]